MNILDELQDYFKTNIMNNPYSVLARVISVDLQDRSCECIDITNSIRYSRVRFNAAGSKSTNFVAPKVDSFVFLSFLDDDNAFIVNVSNPSTYSIKTYKDDKETDLYNSLNSFTEKLETFKNDLLNNIKSATYATPMGVTTPTPINVADFEKTFDNFQNGINDFKENISDLFS